MTALFGVIAVLAGLAVVYRLILGGRSPRVRGQRPSLGRLLVGEGRGGTVVMTWLALTGMVLFFLEAGSTWDVSPVAVVAVMLVGALAISMNVPFAEAAFGLIGFVGALAVVADREGGETAVGVGLVVVLVTWVAGLPRALGLARDPEK